jgi:uncharacterized protein YndB with AHSA1/START domain
MEKNEKTPITVETTVKVPVDIIWKIWTAPDHITQWCQASEDWHAPHAENDLRVHGKFKTTMAARDGSASFDFEGIYTRIQKHKIIEYSMSDGRKVKITFSGQGPKTKVVETFEPEQINSPEMQRAGWQAILDSFKKHAETIQQPGKP